MIILDTNVVSALMRPRENPAVVAWLNSQPRHSIWITTINLMEVRFGLLRMPEGRLRSTLGAAFDALIMEVLQSHILPFDQPAAELAAEITARLHNKDRTIESPDCQIAGIALSKKASLATRNTSDFADIGLVLINPWDG